MSASPAMQSALDAIEREFSQIDMRAALTAERARILAIIEDRPHSYLNRYRWARVRNIEAALKELGEPVAKAA